MVKKKSLQPRVNVLFINKVSEQYMPIQYQSQQQLAWAKMLCRTQSVLCCWLSRIWLSMIKILIWLLASAMSGLLIEIFPLFSEILSHKPLVMLSLKSRSWDRNLQYQPCGQQATIKPGWIQLLEIWSKNQIHLWLMH